MSNRRLRTAALAALAAAGWIAAAPLGRAAAPAAPVLSAWPKWGFDAGNTGWNPREAALIPSAVNRGRFGKLREYPVDGQVYAQPLYLRNVLTPAGTRNLVFVATEHNTVYAFDADAGDPGPVWQRSLGVSVPSDRTGCGLLTPEIGITATPVLDPDSGTLYVVAKLLENDTQVNRIFALDARTGAPVPGWGAALAASVPALDGGAVSLDNALQFCRCGLVLRNGRVYAALASHCDIRLNGYHGWVLAYDTANPAAAPRAWCASPLASGSREAAAGIWMSGAAPASDESGNLYFITGNGPMEVDLGKPLVGNSFVKLTTEGGARLLFGGTSADYFSPSNQVQLDAVDGDLGSGGAMLFSETAGRKTLHLAAAGGKDAILRLLDRDALGGFTGRRNFRARDHALQEIPGFGDGFFSTPGYWASTGGHFLYASGVGGPLVQLQVRQRNGRITLVRGPGTAVRMGYRPATPVISSNGAAAGTGVVWTISQSTGALHAFDAGRISTELYNSNQNGGRDGLDSVVKFAVPMVANGRVYVGTNTRLAIFGPLTAP